MSIADLVIIRFTKFVSLVLRVFRLGSGATWPGEVAIRLNSRFLSTFDFTGKKVIFVLGTNGKTTTCKMIQIILTASGKKVRMNESGANLDNGITSALITDTNWGGELKADVFVFEIDEASLERVSKHIKPDVIVLLNLFRDQLDRYGEVDSIAGKWSDSIRKMNGGDPSTALRMTALLINGDDAQLAYLGSLYKGEVKYFGINNPELFLPVMEHATDSILCPKCGKRLKFGGVYFSHLGKYACGSCGFIHPKLTIISKEVHPFLSGTYNLYNVMAATLAGRALGVGEKQIQEGLNRFEPAFGRSEKLEVNGKMVKVMLSKNPTGFNESLRTAIGEGAKNFLLVLNDQIPDGRDVSWIWDVDFEMLVGEAQINTESDADSHGGVNGRGKTRIVASGERAYDLGLRLKYALPQNLNDKVNFKNYESEYFIIEDDLRSAVKVSLERLCAGETLYILPTYSAMLEVREMLTGRKML